MKKKIKEFLKGKTVTSWTWTQTVDRIGGELLINFVTDPEHERTYTVGDIIKIDDKKYTITLVDDSKCCLCAEDGYSWNMSFEIKSCTNITKQELDEHIQDEWSCE